MINRVEVARLLGISHSTLDRLRDTKGLPFHYRETEQRRRYYYNIEEIQAWLQQPATRELLSTRLKNCLDASLANIPAINGEQFDNVLIPRTGKHIWVHQKEPANLLDVTARTVRNWLRQLETPPVSRKIG